MHCQHLIHCWTSLQLVLASRAFLCALDAYMLRLLHFASLVQGLITYVAGPLLGLGQRLDLGQRPVQKLQSQAHFQHPLSSS